MKAKDIIRFRKANKLTQAELATQLGVRQATISDWETGRVEPSGLALRQLESLAASDRRLNAALKKLDHLIEFWRVNTNNPHGINHAVYVALSEVRTAFKA